MCAQLQDYATNTSRVPCDLTTSDTSNIYNPLKRETRVSCATAASTVSEKVGKDNNKIKKEPVRLPSLHDKSITSQLNSLQWPAFNVNCAFPQPTSTVDRSKANVLELMASNSLVSGAPMLSDEILAQYRYFKAIQQLFPSSTYCPP